MAILEGHGVTKNFRGLVVADEIDFEIQENEIFGLIGPNGSGKTTLLNLINGIYPMTDGEIRFRGHRINGLRPYQITRLGIGRAFQIIRAFEDLTVIENVLVGRLFGTKKSKDIAQGMKNAQEILDFVGLETKSARRISEITVADRKRLELARALVMAPKLLLLDEVMAGLNPREIEDFMKMIVEVNRKGITILMIEHVMKAVMGISTRIMVLHYGRRISLGSPKEISENEEVIKCYLGEGLSAKKQRKDRTHKNTTEDVGPDLTPLLSTKHLQVGYGDIPVLWDVSLTVKHREIISLLRTNGAGKSTLLNAISGTLHPMKGEIHFREKEITFLNPTKRAQMGITQVPEGRLLFAGLTVKQNLRMGAFARRDKTSLQEDLEAIFRLFPLLAERKDQLAGTLSGGEQQMCAIGRGLMAKPELLLIDELSLGLAPVVVDDLIKVLKKIYEQKTLSIVLVEQDVQLGLDISQRADILAAGRIVKSGRSKDLAGEPEIQKAYLGI